MVEGLARRLLVAALLASAVLAVGVGYESQWEDRENYRTTVRAIDADPDAYADRPVYLWLTVESVAENRIVAHSGAGTEADPRVIVDPPEAADGRGSVSASGRGGAVASGDVVQAFGRVRPEACELAAACYRLDAERLVVHGEGNRVRMYLVSAAGGLLAVTAFLRRWQVRRRTRGVRSPRRAGQRGTRRGAPAGGRRWLTCSPTC